MDETELTPETIERLRKGVEQAKAGKTRPLTEEDLAALEAD